MKKAATKQSSVSITRQIIKNELKYFKSELSGELVDRKTFTDFKDRLFNNLDKIAGDLVTIREEKIVIGEKLEDHDNRIGKLETAFKTS